MNKYQGVSNRYSIAEAVRNISNYKPKVSDNSSKEEKKKELSEVGGLELKLDKEEIKEKKDSSEIKVNSAEYFLAEQAYLNSTLPLNYKPFEGEGNSTQKAKEEEYAGSITATDTGSEMLTTQEAEKTHTRMQYASITGAVDEVSYVERQKYSMWIKFNSAFFNVFESQSVTRNVNYGAY